MAIELVDLLDRLQAEVQAKHAEGQALDQKITAARATLAELEHRIGDHMQNLAVKKRLEELQASARKFAESV